MGIPMFLGVSAIPVLGRHFLASKNIPPLKRGVVGLPCLQTPWDRDVFQKSHKRSDY